MDCTIFLSKISFTVKIRMAAFKGYACVPCKTQLVTTKKSVSKRQTYRQMDAGQSDSYVPLCFAGDTKSVSQIHINQVACEI